MNTNTDNEPQVVPPTTMEFLLTHPLGRRDYVNEPIEFRDPMFRQALLNQWRRT